MDATLTYLLLAITSLVVLVGFVVGFLTTRRRRSRRGSTTLDRSVSSPTPSIDTTPPTPSDTSAAPSDTPSPSASQDTELPPALEDIADLESSGGLTTLERPEAPATRLQRLRARLARSNSTMGRGLLSLLSSGSLDDQAWEDLEDTLIAADLGTSASLELVESLRTQVAVDGTTDEEVARSWLRTDLLTLVQPDLDRSIAATRQDGRPAVILVVGVNGVGKTTTVGKLARLLVADDKDVILGAADTFRAAAADQLQTWGERVGVPTVRSDVDGADPASVAFDAVKVAGEMESDVVIVDTAGRLHTKVGLMDELGKVKRVIEKQSPIDEVLLVLDATTGQNGMRQAEVFRDVVGITGVVLTKLDGTAKGGIVVAIQRELQVPVKLVGLGEGPDDLAPFDPHAFVDAIID